PTTSNTGSRSGPTRAGRSRRPTAPPVTSPARSARTLAPVPRVAVRALVGGADGFLHRERVERERRPRRPSDLARRGMVGRDLLHPSADEELAAHAVRVVHR